MRITSVSRIGWRLYYQTECTKYGSSPLSANGTQHHLEQSECQFNEIVIGSDFIALNDAVY